ncbi:MAG: hypothetical protein ABW208_20450 [Pyrinomonadaceae bacterium]
MDDQPRVFKQLDHLLARVEDPRRLFDTLTKTLGLPVAWPFRSYPSFHSGGVALGHPYLEVFQCGERSADTDSIRTLVLKVASPERAETFLRESGMLGSVGEDHIKIDPSKIEGLDVRLVR